jgi:phosphate-selective porin OprO and OprP
MRFASQVANVDRTNWADTGNLTNNLRELEGYYRVGAEAAGIYGPFSIQSEFIGTKLSGKGLNGHEGYSSEDFLYGYYGTISYFLTGESRVYNTKKGAFDRQKANSNFSLKNGGWGAWELAARWDTLDMNTRHVSGGRLKQGTIALNWYLNPHVRIMADYSHIFDNYVTTTSFNSQATQLANTANQHPNIFMVRTQLDW